MPWRGGGDSPRSGALNDLRRAPLDTGPADRSLPGAAAVRGPRIGGTGVDPITGTSADPAHEKSGAERIRVLPSWRMRMGLLGAASRGRGRARNRRVYGRVYGRMPFNLAISPVRSGACAEADEAESYRCGPCGVVSRSVGRVSGLALG